MRLLLDTHIVLAFLHRTFDVQFPRFHRYFAANQTIGFVSIASIWEIAIKSKLGKLEIEMALADIPEALRASGLSIQTIDFAHVIATVHPEPPTRDPFDRLLLAQCDIEDLRLLTIDRALVDHRLAFRL